MPKNQGMGLYDCIGRLLCMVTGNMEGINPSDMVGSFEPLSVQAGELQLDITPSYIKNKISELLMTDNKQDILQRIRDYELSDNLLVFVKKYEQTFGERNVFLWKFLGTVFEQTGVTLSTVDSKYLKSITDSKILFSILCAILDDIADLHRDKNILKTYIKAFDEHPSTDTLKDTKLGFLVDIWNHLLNELKTYPRYEEFKDILFFDFKQFLNNFEYSLLVNEKPSMLNLIEMQNYNCHNMMVYIFNGIDLMVSPDFDEHELLHLRKAFWHAQQMARIGNWLSTWKREIKVGDIGSGVFAYAFSNNLITPQDIQNGDYEHIITKLESSNMTQYFLDSWQENYCKLLSLKESVKSIDMDRYVHGLENVIKFHLATEGLK